MPRSAKCWVSAGESLAFYCEKDHVGFNGFRQRKSWNLAERLGQNVGVFMILR